MIYKIIIQFTPEQHRFELHGSTYRLFSSNTVVLSFPGGSVVKNPPANAGDIEAAGLIPGLGRSPGRRNGNTFQYS